MARWMDPTPEAIEEYRAWVAARPDAVRVLAERFDPWSLYHMRSTGQRVTIAGFSEDGSVRVTVPARFNLTLFEREVFGVDPADLEPCDMPDPSEPVGAMLSPVDVETHIDLIRVAVRPDLFTMAEDGTARRRNQQDKP